MTELHRAAMKGDAQSARSLLLAGAPPDQQDGEGWTVSSPAPAQARLHTVHTSGAL